MRRALTRYFAIATATIAVGGVAMVGGNALFMQRVGEIVTYDQVVAAQSADPTILFGSATLSDMFLYKFKLAEARKPDTLVLGSSRALQLRRISFTGTFVNAGLAMTHFGEGEAFLKELFKRHRPSLVIVPLDFWWFLEGVSDPDHWIGVHQEGGVGGVHRDTLTLPLQWGLAGKIRPYAYLAVILGGWENGIVDGPTIGAQATFFADGFRADGSYHYGSAYFGTKGTWYDALFRNFLGRIAHGRPQFTYATDVHPEAFAAFRRFHRLMVDNGVHPVYLLAPVAHALFQRIDHRFDYVTKVREGLAKEDIEYYDFLDLGILADDCEAVDGIHGGDVAYQRMLLAMIDRNPHGELAKRVDRASLVRNIEVGSGKTLTILSPERYHRSEIDFLEIGCPK